MGIRLSQWQRDNAVGLEVGFIGLSANAYACFGSVSLPLVEAQESALSFIVNGGDVYVGQDCFYQ